MNEAKISQDISKEKSHTEFYDLSERLLNTGSSYWGNLGFWKDANDYSEACEALAYQLALKVNLHEGSRILDIGFGCGDQLLLWLDDYHVEFLSGINYSISQTQLAKQRILESGRGHPDFFIQGDVSDLLSPSLWRLSALSNKKINTVLALDCAYHFPARAQFFANSFNILSRSGVNGCIGLTDIVLADPQQSWSKTIILNTMLNLSHIPKKNIVTLAEYTTELQQAGFEKVESQDISEYVFEPFGDWLKSSNKVVEGFKGNFNAWLKYKVTAYFLAWAFRNKILRYIVVSAQVS